jgi:ClpP class serine protease
MRNPFALAASLSGRPLLLAESAVAPLARQLLLMDQHQPKASPLARLLGHVRGREARRDDDARLSAPPQWSPRWLAEPEAAGFGWVLKDGVAIIRIEGPLVAEGFAWEGGWVHGYDTLLQTYEEVMADARVRAVLEVVDSPGGVVDAGLPELAAFKRAHRADAGGKPVWSFCRRAYSAAYWLVSASDRRVGAREGGVGSIGAVVTHCDMTGALEADGFRITHFKFGSRKTDGSPFEALSDRAAETLQAEIDQCGRWFVADVVAGAGLGEGEVLATEAGCFFVDSDDPRLSGLAIGLVDAVMCEREAYAALRDQIEGKPTKVAAKPNPAPVSGAAPPAAQERDMKRSEVISAARKAGIKASQLARLRAELPEDEAENEEDDADAEADDEEPAAETDEDDAGAESDDEEDDVDAEDDDEGEVNARVARQVLALPEARGREALAQELAFEPGMTVSRARRLLGKAPKKTALSERMQGRDPAVRPGGAASGYKGNKADAALVQAARARREKQKA